MVESLRYAVDCEEKIEYLEEENAKVLCFADRKLPVIFFVPDTFMSEIVFRMLLIDCRSFNQSFLSE